ncbi:universal stress protein [Streptomyces sp. NPDC048664]|uniref:universal stress protein n=1 Tax=Streptomyces sp. NPDC048664 TaxID=3154505 RepID=UPI00342A39CC
MLLPVIAGVDGSTESLAAAEWAAHEAVRRNRPLRLVHAWNWHPRRADGDPASAAQRHLAERVLRDAEECIRAATPEVRLTDEQVEGPATAALLRAADQAELLVLGSRGLSGFTGLLVGSVALGVAAKATRPLVLVRREADAEAPCLPADDGNRSARDGDLDVVLGVDLTETCDEVIEFAFQAAWRRQARLRVVHAWQRPSAIALGPGDIALVNEPHRAEEWQQFLSAVLKLWRDKFPETEVVETVVEGKASTTLVRAASAASLLVVGRHVSDRPTVPRIGPVTQAAVHHVACPLAIVPHG